MGVIVWKDAIEKNILIYNILPYYGNWDKCDEIGIIDEDSYYSMQWGTRDSKKLVE